MREKIIKSIMYIVPILMLSLVAFGENINVQANHDGDIVTMTKSDGEIMPPEGLLTDVTTKRENDKRTEKDKTIKAAPNIINNIKNRRAKIITAERIKNNRTKAKIKIKKIRKITGYQVKYATNKKLKKYRIRTGRKREIILRRLNVKKKYYVRARVYVKNGKKKVYGKWSRKKVIKNKKK